MSTSRHDSAKSGRFAVSRREFLRLIGGGAGLIAASRLLPLSATLAAPPGQAATLIVAANFVIKSLDPARTIETTSEMVNHGTYDSLVTFDGEDLKTPKPSLATSWRVSNDGKTYTFTLRQGVKFSSGNPLTATDVKWSLDRILNLKANSLFLLDGVEDVLVLDPLRVAIRMKAPKPSILPILSSPSLGILDSKLVTEQGGDATADAREKDKAESYLNARSAGTGAYILTRYVPSQEVVLERNPNHWRPAAQVERIVIRNVAEPATEQIQLEKSDIDIATGLGQDQLQALRRAQGVSVKTSPAATTFYVLMNANPSVGGPFANPKIQQAVRYALDYQGILAIAGAGSVRLAGVIPTLFPGAMDPAQSPTTDRDRARSLIRESGISEVRGQLSYASDSTIWGVQMNILAQKIQADLSAVGMRLELNGLPISTSLQQYRDGKNQVGVWSWAADYPDASDFLVYLPGRTVGKRAGWFADASPAAKSLADLGDQVEMELDNTKRLALYQRIDRQLGEIGPYAPLFQPAVPYAFRSNVSGVTFNSVWGVDFYALTRTT